MANDNLKAILKEFVYTDIADEFLVVKLEARAEDSLEWLSGLKPTDPDFHEHVQAVRACVTLLQWYTTETYNHLTVEANKYSLMLDGEYF